ncbi:MAG TPA: alpha/beta hydrolase [Dehalococcoidia bacterium]
METEGCGPPLLLLPTFACSGEAWGVAFARRLTERQFVLRPDWPGTGRSPPWPDGAVTIAALAGAAADLLDTYAAPATLLGWGLGALVALRVAADRPETVERLVLIGAITNGAELLIAAPDVATLCEVAEGAGPEEHMLGLLGRYTCPSWRPFAEMFLLQLLPRPAATSAALRGQWSALAGPDAGPPLGEIHRPVLLLTGELDRVAPPARAEALAAALPDARLCIVPGAGHAVIWEQPGVVLDAIEPFLMRHADAVQRHDPALNERPPR